MKEERLNDELTIVGLFLVLLFILYYLYLYIVKIDHLYNDSIEAKKIAIFLNDRLTKTEQQLNDTNSQLIKLQEQRDEEDHITQILKDIATSWDSRRKN